MTAIARLSLIMLAALLSACASNAPTPSPKPVVHAPIGSFNGSAEDVLFRALGLVAHPIATAAIPRMAALIAVV